VGTSVPLNGALGPRHSQNMTAPIPSVPVLAMTHCESLANTQHGIATSDGPIAVLLQGYAFDKSSNLSKQRVLPLGAR
jgi:hypothetical protein